MLYFASKWDTITKEDFLGDSLLGGMQVVSQGRSKAPIVLAYARTSEAHPWYYEVFSCPKLKLAEFSENPERVIKARSNQRAIEVLNDEYSPAAADILSDLSTGGNAGSTDCKIIFKGTSAANKTPEFMQAFLRNCTAECLRDKVWAK